ncbi:ankyrin repeat domain-containing protein [Aureispira anguillae]|uniref:Ankyrin repeat domain-containing protein n=1 Tax=Aureispira anguillae TaxID=2864201 RepID=A0A916DRX9_9BACT|nr:ankyrin repeat domain-containing protein [Aureispira anguillae]BDS10466.1 ankyrin repeat domain-containing protein [Aureispira anguillae]
MKEELNQAIIVAAEAGDLDNVKKALADGADPNAVGPNSGALHCAAFNGHKAVVDLLLKSGADCNQKDNQSFYPLHLAASKGQVGICNTLIKAGATLNSITEAGGTPLHVAAASDHPKVVTALVKAGANLEARDNNGLTVLAAAASLGRVNVVKKLITVGAEVNTNDNGRDTPLIKSLRYLYQVRIKEWSSLGSNEGKEVKYEVVKGCFRYDNDYDKNNKTKLGSILSLKEQRACAEQFWGPSEHLEYLNTLDTVKVLIKAGADVNASNDSGQTAMSMACHAGEAKLIQELHKKGASFDSKDYQSATPLHRVAGSGRIDGLTMFFKLASNVDINVVDEYGWTPLHYLADIGGHIGMAALLLKKGANSSAKTTKGRGVGVPVDSTPADVALYWDDAEMAAALK